MEFSDYSDSNADDLPNLTSDTESISEDEEDGTTSDVGCGSVWLAIIGDDVGLDSQPFIATSGPQHVPAHDAKTYGVFEVVFE